MVHIGFWLDTETGEYILENDVSDKIDDYCRQMQRLDAIVAMQDAADYEGYEEYNEASPREPVSVQMPKDADKPIEEPERYVKAKQDFLQALDRIFDFSLRCEETDDEKSQCCPKEECAVCDFAPVCGFPALWHKETIME